MKQIKLYKYEPDCDTKLNTLKNGKVWLACPKSFNDPFDCNIAHYDNELGFLTPKQKKEILKTIYPSFNCTRPNFVNRSLYKKIHEYYNSEDENAPELINAIKERYLDLGICCFTASGFDNAVMWAHYANNHKGYCVEYSYSQPLSVDLENHFRRGIIPVTYVQSLPQVELMQLLINPNKVAKNLAAIKNSNWSYEKEYRLISLCCSNNTLNMSQVGLKVSAIYTGLATCKTTVSTLKEVADQLGVSLYGMTIDETGQWDCRNAHPPY